MTKSSNQSINQNTGTIVTFDTVTNSANFSGIYSAGTFTPIVAGYYLVSVWVSWQSSATGILYIQLFKNATTSYAAETISYFPATNINQCISALIPFNGSTDYFYVQCYQTSGGNLNVLAGSTIGITYSHQI